MKKTYGLETQASEEDNFLIQHAVEYAAVLGITGIAQPPQVGTFLKGGDVIRFGESELEVIAIPGHSPGGLCFYSKKDKLLVAGGCVVCRKCWAFRFAWRKWYPIAGGYPHPLVCTG